MKEALKSEGRFKTTVNIPMSKLSRTDRFQGEAKAIDTSSEDRIIVIGGNCCGCSSKSTIDISQIEELEKSYDQDIKHYEEKLHLLSKEKEQQNHQYRIQTETLNLQFTQEISTLKQALLQKQSELTSCFHSHRDRETKFNFEKELLLKSKISQFQSNREASFSKREQEVQSIFRSNQLKEKEILLRLDHSEMQRQKLAQQLEQAKTLHLYDLDRSKLQIEDLTKKATQSRGDIEHLRSQNVIYEHKIRQFELKEAELYKMIAYAESTGIQKIEENQKLQVDLSLLKSQSDQHFQQLEENRSNLNASHDYIAKLKLQLVNQALEIKKLNEDFNTKDKVYEIKIQRVIDGKEKIQALQLELAGFHQTIETLKGQNQAVEEELKKRHLELNEQKMHIDQLRIETAELKAYISKKEKSFAWIVERQIERDIEISEDRDQAYKVVSVRETHRVKEEEYNSLNYQKKTEYQHCVSQKEKGEITIKQTEAFH